MLNARRYQTLVIENTKERLYKVLLRIGVSATFLGHGMMALQINENWIPLITAFGFQDHTARNLLPIIGCMDVFMAAALLVYPIRAVIIWAIVWPLMAALSRPISGQPVWEFVERSSNWIVPLVLLCLAGFPKKWKELWTL